MSAPSEQPQPPGPPRARWPRQVAYIIGNEGCERFSFYGMRNILTPFLASSALLFAVVEAVPKAEREAAAKEVFHTFVLGVYFFPLLGGWLADRLLGKYRTILYLSLVYCVGQACLAAFFDNKAGFYVGLFLVALGSGGIKPCVSAFVGDQFDQSNKSLARLVFDAFYWIINFGSFFASLLMPVFLRDYGPAVAFGIPGVLMFVSTVILWLGRRLYVDVPPAPPHPDSFVRVARSALTAPAPTGNGRPGLLLALVGALVAGACLVLGFVDLERMTRGAHPLLGVVSWWCLALVAAIGFTGVGTWWQLDRARAAHPADAVEGARSVLRVLVLFALVTPFWSLFDQKASTWVLQGNGMTKPAWFVPAQMQALNPLLVMLLIPFNNLVLYPAIRRAGFEPTPLRRMGAGIAFSGLSWVVIGVLQLSLDAGEALSITWQVLPYALLTLGEVLVSATGLEFAYSQAPAPMKGAILAFWSLSVTVGNLWVLLANVAVRNDAVTRAIGQTGVGVMSFQMFFFAAFAFAAAVAFGAYAARYPLADHYRTTG
ncbi:POT-type proton-dependent oligopeptide transporter [Urbifossiella limnaea]|uniref:Di-/tripeptide transporter n=1 Tax=Urbifossiella limnaea TaxID=2528023 RepID=A0A517Y197_9BACT|nr:MFS transporter [Urbifossiella limnaea]QDU23525.1 Di-/tripeptide transporter [Urbifossiella limnaea]